MCDFFVIDREREFVGRGLRTMDVILNNLKILYMFILVLLCVLSASVRERDSQVIVRLLVPDQIYDFFIIYICLHLHMVIRV